MADESTHENPVIPAPGSGTTTVPGGKSKQTGSPGVRPTILAGFSVIALFFGGLGTWAALAPLESAAIAPGAVGIDTNRKTIQHLEGGIVREILVRDGDVVAAGQPMIRLDETQARATLDLLKGRQLAAAALEARLIAERDRKYEIDFPDWPPDALEDSKVAKIIDGQISIFKARRKALLGQVAIQEQQIAQLYEEIWGLEGQIKAENFQLMLLRDEIEGLRELVKKKVVPKPHMVALQRGAAEIEGRRSQDRARIARARQKIGEVTLRITDLRTRMINEIVLELRDVQSELLDLAERIRAARDVLRRTAIRAPLTGTIVGLQVHTLGGVIGPGEPLMDIVPSGDRLVIEAQINPIDIDVVHPGLLAQVRLMPFSMRNTAPLEGRITSVSADRLTDERTGESYYLARVELNEDPANALGGASLYPGMPAEVMVVTGVRTALGYIFKPITASLNRAFREE